MRMGHTSQRKPDEIGSATLSLNLQNEYDQLSCAIKAVKSAERDLRQAEMPTRSIRTDSMHRSEYERLQRVYERGEGFIEQADLDDFERRLDRLRSDDDYYQTNIVLAATTLASKTTALIRQGGKAAASSGTGGFNLSMSLDIEAFEQEVETWYEQSLCEHARSHVDRHQGGRYCYGARVEPSRAGVDRHRCR